MANTNEVKERVFEWVRSTYLSSAFHQRFAAREVRLQTDGMRGFPAVSDDSSIVAAITTSGDKTSSGKGGDGKKHKVRSELLFLMMARAPRKVMVFTDQDNYAHFRAEREKGWVPHEVELMLVELPPELRTLVAETRQRASREVTPR